MRESWFCSERLDLGQVQGSKLDHVKFRQTKSAFFHITGIKVSVTVSNTWHFKSRSNHYNSPHQTFSWSSPGSHFPTSSFFVFKSHSYLVSLILDHLQRDRFKIRKFYFLVHNVQFGQQGFPPDHQKNTRNWPRMEVVAFMWMQKIQFTTQVYWCIIPVLLNQMLKIVIVIIHYHKMIWFVSNIRMVEGGHEFKLCILTFYVLHSTNLGSVTAQFFKRMMFFKKVSMVSGWWLIQSKQSKILLNIVKMKPHFSLSSNNGRLPF